MFKKILFYFTIFFLLFPISCKQKNEEGEAEIKTKTPVTITNISKEPITETIELTAVSSYLKKVSVRSTITGTIDNVELNIGDKVKKGALLFSVITKEAEAISSKISSNDTNYNFKGLIKINSTRNGVITSITHHKGDYVQEGDELAVISDVESLVFLLQVPFELTKKVRQNIDCDILLADDRVLKGRIDKSLPVMDAPSQTENFIIKPNISDALPENLTAKVKIIKSFKNEAYTVPKDAVLANEAQTEYWVMKLINDSTAVKILIKKGVETNDKVEILEPVFLEKDRILLSGNYGLEDTARVLITDSKMKEKEIKNAFHNTK